MIKVEFGRGWLFCYITYYGYVKVACFCSVACAFTCHCNHLYT